MSGLSEQESDPDLGTTDDESLPPAATNSWNLAELAWEQAQDAYFRARVEGHEARVAWKAAEAVWDHAQVAWVLARRAWDEARQAWEAAQEDRVDAELAWERAKGAWERAQKLPLRDLDLGDLEL
jgi:hypothetical protein